jgi:hypothetical protein
MPVARMRVGSTRICEDSTRMRVDWAVQGLKKVVKFRFCFRSARSANYPKLQITPKANYWGGGARFWSRTTPGYSLI